MKQNKYIIVLLLFVITTISCNDIKPTPETFDVCSKFTHTKDFTGFTYINIKVCITRELAASASFTNKVSNGRDWIYYFNVNDTILLGCNKQGTIQSIEYPSETYYRCNGEDLRRTDNITR